MKKIICTFILAAVHFICLGQSEYGEFSPIRDENGAGRPSRDSAAQKTDVPHFRYTWTWMHNGVYAQEVPQDTLQDGIQNFNYIFKKSISNTYLGNFPSPYESNIFIERPAPQDFHPVDFLRAYFVKPGDIPHFNTTTPFTRLRYFTGGGKGKAENLLDAWHVQNITPFWNAGLRYNLISSDGRYADQKSKVTDFAFFTSYERDRIAASVFFNRNKGEIGENGGIRERYFITDSTEKAENIPVWLTGNEAENIVRNLNVNAQMQYNIGTPKPVVRENDTSYTYPAKAVLNIRTEGNRRRFREESINLEYYRHTYIDSTQTSDDYRNNIVEVSAKFVVNEHPKYKYLPGIYAGLDFRHEKYDQRTGYDTLIRQEYFGKRKYSGTYITAGLFNVDTNALMNFDVAGRLAVLGHYAGNFSVDGYISQALRQDKSSLLRADARFELQSANPFFNRYVGNHDRWENDFKAVKTIRVEGRYINKRLRTDVGVGFTNLFSHIYFDSTAMPRQFNKALVVFTAWGKEVFRAGHFYFDQSVYFQKSMQEDILSLPAISLYSHNYYQNYLFKGALQLQVGIDLFYNTSFYADNYAPSIMQFHLQREHKTGNYPKVDAFLNLHIKRAQLFVKYEHANYHIKRKGNFFSAADYPINPGMLKFGVQWDFFD